MDLFSLQSVIDHTHSFFQRWNALNLIDPFRSFESLIPEISCEHMPSWAIDLGDKYVANFSPCEFWDSICFLTMTLGIMTVAWVVVKLAWAMVSSKFATIQPAHKQWYVVANVSKAFMLGLLAISPWWTYGVFKAFVEDEWSSQIRLVKRSSAFYLATDILALVMVPKLPSTTIIHHVVATLLTMSIFFTDLEKSEVPKMIALYGCWSTLAFPVNLYLALRVMYDKKQWTDMLAGASLTCYILCCAGNWGAHMLWFASKVTSWSVTWPILIYSAAIVSVVRDDIILMTWLWHRGTGKSTDRDVFIKKRTYKAEKKETKAKASI